MFREDVKAKIAAVSGLRVYSGYIADTVALPAIRFKLENTNFEPTMQDAAAVKDRFISATVEAKSAEEVDEACDALLALYVSGSPVTGGLSGFGGMMGGTRVIRCYPTDDLDEEYPPDFLRYGRTVKFRFQLG